MQQQEPSVISIWIGDPVGGVFVDWAPDGDECYIDNTLDLCKYFSEDGSRLSHISQLSEWKPGASEVWIRPGQLRSVVTELSQLCENIVETSEPARESLLKILHACEFALTIEMAGVFIS
jgi:hypothetical protein